MCCVLVVFSSPVFVLYLVSPFSFQPIQMFTSVFNERSRSNPLCDFRLGTVVTADYETPLTRWDDVLLSMSKIPSNEILENLYKLRIREFDQLKTVLELYDMEIHQKISVPTCQKLITMVMGSTDQKLRSRNFDARHGRIESGAVIKSRKGLLIGVEGGRRYLFPVERKRPVFARRPVQFPA